MTPIEGDICWEGQADCACEEELGERGLEYFDEDLGEWLPLIE